MKREINNNTNTDFNLPKPVDHESEERIKLVSSVLVALSNIGYLKKIGTSLEEVQEKIKQN